MDNKLSNNFTLDELIKSETAKRLGIDNNPTEEIIVNLKNLAQNVLQPIRDHIKVPIKINSGYRSEKLNKIVGGKTNSQHLRGEAADIVPLKDLTVKELFDEIKKMVEDGKLVVDQCIHEMSHEVDWVHISYTTKRNNRNMFITLKV